MPITEKIYRTVIYCRLSKEDGDKLVSNSIEGQISYCKDFISSQKDLKLIAEPLCDDGYTGLNFQRPSFEKLDYLVKNQAIDCIVCKDLSRFTRDFGGGGEYLEKILPMHGVRFIAINNCDTLKDDAQRIAFMLPVINLINDNYSRDTSVKIRSSLNIKRKDGDYVGAACPFGYKKSPANKHKLVVDVGASETVQLIFRLFKDGQSLQQIADELNKRGILTPLTYRRKQGENISGIFQTKDTPEWEYNTVKRILTNEAYVGVLIQKKTSSKNYKIKKQYPVPESEQIRVENAIPSLVSLDEFLAVQEMMTRNTRSSPKEGTSNSLSGFVFCADCGATMIKKTQKPYAYFICSGHKKNKNCSSHSIRCAEVEERVLSAIHKQVEIIADMEKVLEMFASEESDAWLSSSYEEKIEKLEEDIARFKKKRLNLYHHLNDDVINRDEYSQFRDEYSEYIEEKEKEKLRLEKQSREYFQTGTKQWSKFLNRHDHIEELNKNLLMSMIDKVLIHDNHGLEIVFKCCDELTRMTEYITFRTQDNKLLTI